jgi:hypothetical protein
VPSAILETLSHQNFTDMRYGLDPSFRFNLARSVYKTILRYITGNHNDDCVVTPLAPTDLRIQWHNRSKGEVMLQWTPVIDSLEESATATEYIVYTACGHADFDNGQTVNGTSYKVKLEPNELYSFRVAAVNRGGCSFPTAVVTARYSPTATKDVLIIDGFQRVAAPAVVNNSQQQGFDIDSDMGISFGTNAGWAGRQLNFDRSRPGIEDSTGLGYGSDDMAGSFIAGNTFDYVKAHAETIKQTGIDCNILSCDREAVEHNTVDICQYSMIDLILGLQRNDGYSMKPFPAFTTGIIEQLWRYYQHGGAMLASGAYIGQEMMTNSDQARLNDIMKCRYTGIDNYGTAINGLGTSFDIYRKPNGQHYCASNTDILEPQPGAMSVMAYADGYSAAVAYADNRYRALTMGFPLECIQQSQQRTAIMNGIMNYLINN